MGKSMTNVHNKMPNIMDLIDHLGHMEEELVPGESLPLLSLQFLHELYMGLGQGDDR
ncbi:hypothetical protein HAX54_023142, partial [Datura stramonium]|nr:hypothetical protein [Datura stramonium]